MIKILPIKIYQFVVNKNHHTLYKIFPKIVQLDQNLRHLIKLQNAKPF